MPKELAIWSTVHGCNFFKEINSDGCFSVPQDCQHDLLYWLSNPEVFLCLFLLHGLSLWLRLVVANPCLAWSTLFNLPPFWIASKEIFLWDLNNFCYKPISNHVEFTFMEKKFLKRKIAFFQKNSPYLLNDPHIYITMIKILF